MNKLKCYNCYKKYKYQKAFEKTWEIMFTNNYRKVRML